MRAPPLDSLRQSFRYLYYPAYFYIASQIKACIVLIERAMLLCLCVLCKSEEMHESPQFMQESNLGEGMVTGNSGARKQVLAIANSGAPAAIGEADERGTFG